MTFQERIVELVGNPPDKDKVREIARRAGVSLPTVSRWARGASEPHPAMQKMIFDCIRDTP